MKKASEIFALPVLSIADGAAVDRIARLAVDPESRRVEYAALSGTPWYELPRVLPWSALQAVGRDLVTIANREGISRVDEALRAKLARTVDVIGARAVDTAGRECGTVADIELDEATGELKELILEGGGSLEMGKVLALGAQAVVAEGGAAAARKREAPGDENDILLGKTVAADISDGKGKVVAKAGTVVTRKVIEAARAAGALFDLVTGVK
jgi:sporulation protein YlmC with PRC-barrel domain